MSSFDESDQPLNLSQVSNRPYEVPGEMYEMTSFNRPDQPHHLLQAPDSSSEVPGESYEMTTFNSPDQPHDPLQAPDRQSKVPAEIHETTPLDRPDQPHHPLKASDRPQEVLAKINDITSLNRSDQPHHSLQALDCSSAVPAKVNEINSSSDEPFWYPLQAPNRPSEVPAESYEMTSLSKPDQPLQAPDSPSKVPAKVHEMDSPSDEPMWHPLLNLDCPYIDEDLENSQQPLSCPALPDDPISSASHQETDIEPTETNIEPRIEIEQISHYYFSVLFGCIVFCGLISMTLLMICYAFFNNLSVRPMKL